MEQQYQVKRGDGGHRIDVVLTAALGHTRSYWQKQLKLGHITLSERTVKPGYLVQAGELITIQTPGAVTTAPEIPVVYEDDDLLIVNKPAGMLVHPTATSREEAVSHFAARHTADSDAERPGIVHRLDRETSGLLILAKTTAAKGYLQQLFKSRHIKKTYLALVVGHLDQPKATIDLPIGRNLRHPSRRAVTPVGRNAVTQYAVEHEWPGYSLVRVQPQTGRTHQIRVHLSHVGHPVVGDMLYGGQNNGLGLRRQFLHAAELEFDGPGGKHISVVAPLPPDLQAAINDLNKRYNG